MGCAIIAALLFSPRIVMFVIFLCTNWFSRAYETAIWPFLGFFLMPFTTLTYMWASISTNRNVGGGWIVLLTIAVVIDLGIYSGAKAQRS
jgi:hypothetical protein